MIHQNFFNWNYFLYGISNGEKWAIKTIKKTTTHARTPIHLQYGWQLECKRISRFGINVYWNISMDQMVLVIHVYIKYMHPMRIAIVAYTSHCKLTWNVLTLHTKCCVTVNYIAIRITFEMSIYVLNSVSRHYSNIPCCE